MNLHLIILSSCLLLTALEVSAQTAIDTLVSRVEANHPGLRALRAEADAQRIENLTGIQLDDPEVELGYLWGSPSTIGHRTDVSVSQSFDVATLSGSRRRLARGKNRQAESRYLVDRQQLRLELRQCVVDAIYTRGMMKLMAQRVSNMRELAALQQRLLDRGECTILDVRNMQLNLRQLESRSSLLLADWAVLCRQLTFYNGGEPLEIVLDSLEIPSLPATYAEWESAVSAVSPLLSLAREEVLSSRDELILSRQEGMPRVSVGYLSEKVMDEHFQGITVGLSVPLWSNKNKVRRAKAASVAAGLRQQEAELRFRAEAAQLYDKTKNLREVALDCRRMLVATSNNAHLLRKALQAGEISVTDYLLSESLFYDAAEKALEAVRDCQREYSKMVVLGAE